jgi:glycosyltransferase involved in cell wall biosynthesis
MSKSVWFVLDARYPTEKAYGVTTGFTAKAVEILGNYNVTLVTPKIDKNIEKMIKIIEVKIPFYNVRHGELKKDKLFYNLGKLLYPIKLSYIIKRNNSIIWLRDIRMALVFSLLGYRVICEIHRTPSAISKIELSFLKIMPKITLVLISEYLREKLGIKITNSVIAGMAVDKNELSNIKQTSNGDQFVVGYIGSSHSSGNKLSIKVVLEAASALELINSSIKFRFIGFQISDYDQLTISSLPKNVEFLGRISRFDIIKEIDKFDIGLVIYPDTDYFLDSFPIKIVEYAARHIPIVASNTRANKRILENHKALYFNLNSSDSLTECIIRVAQDKKIAESISSNAFEWVKLLTYENRAIKVLNKADPEWAGSYER